MKIEQNLFYKANKEFYVDVFFSWFFRQLNSDSLVKICAMDFLKRFTHIEILNAEKIKCKVWPQYQIPKSNRRVDLWIEIVYVTNKGEINFLPLIIENKIFASETFKNQLDTYKFAVSEYYKGEWLIDAKNNYKKDFPELKKNKYLLHPLIGLYIKLDVLEEEIKNNLNKNERIDLNQLNNFFKNYSNTNSEILNNFSSFLTDKTKKVKTFLGKSYDMNQRLSQLIKKFNNKESVSDHVKFDKLSKLLFNEQVFKTSGLHAPIYDVSGFGHVDRHIEFSKDNWNKGIFSLNICFIWNKNSVRLVIKVQPKKDQDEMSVKEKKMYEQNKEKMKEFLRLLKSNSWEITDDKWQIAKYQIDYKQPIHLIKKELSNELIKMSKDIDRIFKKF